MATITLDQIRSREDALVQFARDVLSDARWGANDALRHLVIRAFAYILTSLEQERSDILGFLTRDGLLEQDLENDQDAIDLANAFIRNLAITTGEGSYGRGSVFFKISLLKSVLIENDLQITIDDQTFTTAYAEDRTFLTDEMTAIRDANGVIIGYGFDVPFVADEAGETGNVDVGPVTDFPLFDPNVYAAEVRKKFEGGGDATKPAEVLENPLDYLGSEVLDNEANVERWVRQIFPDILAVESVLMGDPLMARDRLLDEVPSLNFHAGGMMDVYLTTNVVDTILSDDLRVGNIYRLPNQTPSVPSYLQNIFFYDSSKDFSDEGVLPGDTLYLRDNWSGSQYQFVVKRVWEKYLMVREEAPFPQLSDSITYSIGRRGPEYEDIVPGIGGTFPTTGETSAYLQVPGAVLLPTTPFIYLTEVSFLDPTNDNADPTTGRVYFTRQVNTDPQDPAIVQELEYRIETLLPLRGGSVEGLALLHVGDYASLAERSLLVKAATAEGYATVSEAFLTETERSGIANILFRIKHGARVTMEIRYKLRSGAGEEDFEETELKEYIARFVTQQTDNEEFGLDDIVEAARAEFSDVLRSLYIDTAKTILSMPTGDVVQYDGLVYNFDTATPEARFVGDVLPDELPSELGVGRKTVQFYCVADFITAEKIT